MLSIDRKYQLRMIPMPPTVNTAYPTDFRTGRRFKSGLMKTYEKRIGFWSVKRCTLMNEIIEFLSWVIPSDHTVMIRLDIKMYFQYEDLFTKKAPFKRKKMNDVENRLKPLCDCLATILGQDDSLFCFGSIEPILVDEGTPGQWIDVDLSFDRIKKLTDLIQMELK